MLKHLVSARQLTPEVLTRLFSTTREIEEFWVKHRMNSGLGKTEFLQRFGVVGKTMIPFFYESSTRTRVSFHMAWRFLGGDIPFTTEHAGIFSSAAKGESLEDTIQVLSHYGPDLIVLRHPDDDSGERAATSTDISPFPTSIINAGSGSNEHPTQALLDAYTIQKFLHRTERFSIAFMGDLAKGRTVRSLAILLSQYPGVRMYFVAPALAQIGDDLRQKLRAANVEFYEMEDGWQSLIKDKAINFLYQTRLQEERWQNQPDTLAEILRLQPFYTITEEIGLLMYKHKVLLMHPMPIRDEIAVPVRHLPCYIAYLQAQCGFFTRMGLMSEMIHAHETENSVWWRNHQPKPEQAVAASM